MWSYFFRVHASKTIIASTSISLGKRATGDPLGVSTVLGPIMSLYIFDNDVPTRLEC